MALKTHSSAKKSKASKAPSTVSKRNSRRTKSRNNNSDDSSIASDDQTSDILMSPRQNEFSERTWWMVDMESTNYQGATSLVKRCMRVYGWSIEKSRRVLTAYSQFLALKKEYKDWDAIILSPSFWVDQMWHQHILDVVNYNHDMMLLCGRVVGHNPDGALSGKAERDEATRNALEKQFPTSYNKEVWGVEIISTNHDTSSGAGEGEDEPIEEEGGSGSNNDTNNNATANNATTANNNSTNNTIAFRIIDNKTHEETPFVVNKTANLATLFDTYAARKGVPVSELIFRRTGLLGGYRAAGAGYLQLENNDIFFVDRKASYYRDPITIIIQYQTGEKTHFNINGWSRMETIFGPYAASKGVCVTSLRFMIDGEQILANNTPANLWLGDQDEIVCFLGQGGC